ncbi:McrC family protein [Helicobacter sp. MIT 05-5293]|uniref:McrC family protein n=1 Tax=Helicobacter sp. MIT 05-5293 TaxID=1548149 RepID=UPI00068CB22C|nr:McrC family protein [Helicobacter sp. MIT 05-5293]
MKTNNTLCIAEWQSFGANEIEQVCGDKKKAQKIFDELVEFAHQEGNHCFLKFKNSKTLVAQNYVGLIQAKSGFCLEILPKTFRTAQESQGFNEAKNTQEAINTAKNILIEMLKSLKDSPFEESHVAHLKAQKLPLLEIFILIFLNDLENLIKNGLKSDYMVQEENRKFLKGKLLFNENLKYNFAHKERFFTSSDEFSQNIAPNRIIRSTLEFLSKQNLSSKTTRKLAQARFIFADIPPSANIDKDLSQCQNMRSFKHYRLLLQWCEIFLRRKSFSVYNGDSQAFALLVDMNVLFESFVASEMKKWCSDENFRAKNSQYQEVKNIFIKTQEKSKFLAEKEDKNIFQLKPDIVGYEKDSEEVLFIADTKWKILSTQDRNYGISQSDMYQMFAYLAKYQCNQGFLIYPKIGFVENREFIFKPESAKGVKLKICFFDIEV